MLRKSSRQLRRLRMGDAGSVVQCWKEGEPTGTEGDVLIEVRERGWARVVMEEMREARRVRRGIDEGGNGIEWAGAWKVM